MDKTTEKYYLLNTKEPEYTPQDLDIMPVVGFDEAMDELRRGQPILAIYKLKNGFYGEFPSDEYSKDVFAVMHDVCRADRNKA